MGYYINPVDDQHSRSKSDIIKSAGRQVKRIEFLSHAPGTNDEVGVALVDNIDFVAAGIAYSKDEAEVFASSTTRRVEFVIMKISEIERLDPPTGASMRRRFPNG